MERLTPWFASLALIVGCNGSDTKISHVDPIAAVSPEVLSFGDVAVDYSSTLDIQVINSGQVDLTISDLEIADNFTIGAHEDLVGPDEQISIPITFLPTTYASYAGSLLIHTDDPEHETLTVTLTGTGVDAPTPDIDVDPLVVDFGAVSPGIPGMDFFTIANLGDGALSIESVAQSGSGAFLVTGLTAGVTLAGGDDRQVIVQYAPVASTGDHGEVTITSDDPDEPSVTVSLLGNGGGADFEYPVPVIDCPLSVAPRDTVALDGTGSYDPENNVPLTYSWVVSSVPPGSQAQLSSTDADTAYFATDIAGAYAVTLAVTNSIGVSSAPTMCVFTAVPEEELHVELTWSTASADLDLHLLAPGGEFFIDPYDCNYCNQSPDWGAAGSAQNPSLDIDDYIGYGPENINDESPADGTYSIKVHYFVDNGDSMVTATVKVYLYGVLAGEESRAMDRDDVWDAGQILWPDGLYVEQSTDLYSAPRRGCE